MIDRAWSPALLHELAASIRAQAGLNFAPDRYDELERRTRLAMAKAGISEVREYSEGLEAGRLSFDDWVAELTVGETYFFREPHHFEFLRRRAIPGLLAARAAGHVFRVWSAGCASGEEAYSLAILFEEQLLGASLHLLATDISRAALEKARLARFGAWSLRGTTDDFVDLYFRRLDGRQFELVDRIRRQVRFEYLNLARGEYPSFFTGVWGNDVIFCRNVLIYLDRETVRGVARRLFDSLADGGWLVTGPSDPPLGDYAPYETVVTDDGIFYWRARSRAVTKIEKPQHSAPSELPLLTALSSMTPDEGSPRAGNGAPLPSIAGHVAEHDAGEDDVRALARAAFVEGNYRRAIDLVRSLADDSELAALEVRATANLVGAREASRLCTAALLRFPLATELYVLQASLLLDLCDYDAASQAARRLLYLDRSLVVAHLLLGSILGKQGEREGAMRAFRNARELLRSAPPNDVIPFTDGDRAGRLADFARAQMQLLGSEPNEWGSAP